MVTTSSTGRDRTPWYDGQSLLAAPRTALPRRLAALRAAALPCPARHPAPVGGRRRVPRLPRLRRTDRLRPGPRRRCRHGAAQRTYQHRHRHRHRRQELDEAFAPQSVTLRLADDIDISRGDLIVTSRSVPPVTQDIDGTIAWLAEGSLVPGDQGAAQARDPHGAGHGQGDRRQARPRRRPTAAGRVPRRSTTSVTSTLRLAAPIPAEEYLHARGTGAFLLIDAQDGGTLAAGMVGDALLDTKAAVDAIGETTVLV